MDRRIALSLVLFATLAACTSMGGEYETIQYVPEELEAALTSDEPARRADAAEQILAMKPEQRIKVLVELTRNPKPEVRLMAVSLLGRHHPADDQAVAALSTDVMLDGDPDVRVAALGALARSGRTDALGAIATALTDDPSLTVRREAAALLDRLTGETIGTEFSTMVDDATEKGDDAAMAYDDWIETNREKLTWNAEQSRFVVEEEAKP